MLRTGGWLATCALVAWWGCSGDDSIVGPGAPGGSTGSTSGTGGGGGAGGSTSTSTSGTAGAGGDGGGEVVCAGDGLAPGKETYTIQFGGIERQYDLQVPLSYDHSAPIPLVLDFHGYMSDNWQQAFISGFADKSQDEGFAVAWPNGFGVSKSWNAGDYCCGQAQSQGLDDVGLAKAIVQQISDAMCIDPKRIYATGISNGGALSHRLACEAADVFAAVAPVAYPLDFNPLSQCQPSRPIAVMHLHGLTDPLVLYGGGLNSVPVVDSFAYWAQANTCSDAAEVSYSKGNSECLTHDSCDGAVEVTLCSVNGGHILYTNLDNVPIADLAWDFLSSYTLP
ncbi:MAG: prolyl oligopeptidase family serine peptidase [Deltaproteobacteria bacterium]|nr:prolyl oligopeptidase family serine peptidase [Deltaproteobacteria bacterium]